VIDIGSAELAKYPFLPDAGRYLQEQYFTIEKLGTDPDLKKIVERAYQRVKLAAEGEKYKADDMDGYALDMEVFSFLVAIILLKLCSSAALVSKFVMAESIKAEGHLESDIKDLRYSNAEQPVIKIIEDLFSITVQRQGANILIPVRYYVRHSVLFHELPWKLVNRRVKDGMVILSVHEVVRLIRQELNKYIAKRIRSSAEPPMLPNFEEAVQKLKEIAKRFPTKTVQTIEYPPCIKHAIKALSDGENLPHSGRFMLASYLFSKGKLIEEIAPLFKNAPDYNERITLYQLKHISKSGHDGGYICPSCAKIKSNDLCFETKDCNGIVNPLQFGRRVNAR